MNERDCSLSIADTSPTLRQILDERNPRLVDLMEEQTVDGKKAQAWCHRCDPVAAFANIAELNYHVRQVH